ncbi:MAG: AAA family ATPase [Planctomycetota bacterium]|nr:AAA family ATPase [Planctomycetota bacterium]
MDLKETPAVYKYFDPLDRFVRIRVVGAAELRIADAEDLDKTGYRRAVIRACVDDFGDAPEERLAEIHPADPAGAEELLYLLAVAVNPALDLRTVDLEPGAPSLLEAPTSQPARSRGDGSSERLRRLAPSLEERLRARVFGQDEAVALAARAVRRAAAGLSSARGPIASLLFVGPTGTGKTELARALADELAPAGFALVRVDCGELALGHEHSRLTGAPPGFVGHEAGGSLTEALHRSPRAVVLFDEIEKAHPRVHDLLLAVLEEGELTDGRGRRASLSQSIVVLTSNAGARVARSAARGLGFASGGLTSDARIEIARSALDDRFSPEFLGRVDEIAFFNELELPDARRIATAKLADLAVRARRSGMRFRWTDAVARWAAEEGFSSESGAREIGRVIRRGIEAPLADEMLAAGPDTRRFLRVSIRRGRPHVAPD